MRKVPVSSKVQRHAPTKMPSSMHFKRLNVAFDSNRFATAH